MQPAELKAFIRQVSKEKELDPDVVKDAVEQSIIAASKKSLSAFTDARVLLDPETGEMQLFVIKEVVRIPVNPRTQISLPDAKKMDPNAELGSMIEVEIDPSALGRIAAQSARQFVVQKLREAERNKVLVEFQSRKGEVVSAEVVRTERLTRGDRPDFVLTIGKCEAVLTRRELPPNSRLRQGDRIKVYVLEVDPEARGPLIKVSRTHPQLVEKLFEQEVPEVAQGTVKIVNVARDPGFRSKIAVQSTDKNVDPVGACVGLKGQRVQAVVRELENEKIDIVPFSDDAKEFIKAALVPAAVGSVILDEDTQSARVALKEGNLALAYGKNHQNSRLASKLTGWKLELHVEGEEKKFAAADRVEIERKYLEDLLSQIDTLSDEQRQALLESEFHSVQSLAEAKTVVLAEFLGGDVEAAESLIEDATDYFREYQEMTHQTPASATDDVIPISEQETLHDAEESDAEPAKSE